MNWFYIVIGFCFFLLITCTFSPAFSEQFAVYRKLDRRKRLGWDQRVTSFVHSILVSLLALYHVLTYKEPYSDPSELARFMIHLVMAYIIQDTFVIIVLDGDTDSKADILHHVFTTCLCYISQLGFDYWHLIATYRVLAELSTPLLNVRWFIYAFGKNKDPIFTWNNLAFAVSFFVSRIAVMPYFYGVVQGLLATEVYNQNVGPITHVTWLAVVVMMDVLNLYWFSFIAKKVVRSVQVVMTSKQSKLIIAD